MFSNSTKVWIFILITNLVLLVSGFIFWERLGLFLSFLLSVILHYFIFRGHQSPLMKIFEPKKIIGLDPWNLQKLNSQIQLESNQAVPELFVTDVPILNSFIIKTPWKKGRIVFSRELLKKLNAQELSDLLTYHSHCLEELNSFPNELLLILFSTFKALTNFFDNTLKIHIFEKFSEKIIVALQKLFFTSSYITRADQKVGVHNSHIIDYAMMIWKCAGWNSQQDISIPASQAIYFFIDPMIKKNHELLKIHPKMSFRLKKITGYYPI